MLNQQKMRARDGCRTAGLVSVPDPSLAGPDLPGEGRSGH